MNPVSPTDAAAALAVADRERRQVLERVGVPAWYWWSVALGWIVLGVITDLRHPLVTSIATFVFGAVHASVAPRAVHGRRGHRDVSLRRELVGRRLTAVVLGGVVAMAAVTTVAAIVLSADGARHPVTEAAVLVAVLVLLGGPALVSRERRRLALAGRTT